SACSGFENGLANSSGTVGKYLMAQAGNVIMGRFSDLIRMYKGPPANALTEEFYETDPKRDFVRGFAIQTVGPLPISFAKQLMAAKGSWGWEMRRAMMDYNHWSAFGLLGEILPWDDNRIELAEETDKYGLPVAKITFALHDNDKKLISYGRKVTEDVMWAAGAEEVAQEARYAHLVGAARMGKDARTSVVDGFGQSHDIANLFICDGSVMPTQGSANPGLTIQALAARTADYLISERENVLSQNRQAGRIAPPIRHDLSPRGTSGRGVPRLKGEAKKAYERSNP
ncbi:MAG TPA: GMC family oxidoreductase, partial [Chloroflexota bacterium]|nr:GMC family oxidoreductase [Chloroflexota bacterium]